jgi:hypothetical protein
MGGVLRIRHLGRRSDEARREGAFGRPGRVSRRFVARLVDAGADRRGSQAERARLVEVLAQRLVENFGDSDIEAARATEEEVAFVESLCRKLQHTLIAVQRSYEDGAVRETFSTLKLREGHKLTRAFVFL